MASKKYLVPWMLRSPLTLVLNKDFKIEPVENLVAELSAFD